MTLNVLVFPGGTEIGLEIRRALGERRDIRLFSAGLDIPNHAPYVFARHFLVPSVHGPGWVERLNEILAAEHIDYIFPAYDDVILALAENAERLKARVVSSPLRTCLITRSKSQTYELFAGVLPVPARYTDAAAVPDGAFPVFVKPDRGQGSQGTHLVYTREELALLLQDERAENIALEYLPGEEYTVDCFSDREAGLLFCGPRRRIRTKNGLAMTSRPVMGDVEVFTRYARLIAGRLALYGAWFFQLKAARDGTLTLQEIAPRIAGTMALNRVRGVNFALLSLFEQERVPIEVLLNDVDVEIDRAVINRYRHSVTYGCVYVDLDDTLIVNESVNVPVAGFLYQCVNRGIPLVLLTRHAGDVDATLRRYRLAGLFDEIVHVQAPATKADYVRRSDAILVDDSFQERRQVRERCGILTFDCSMLEMLIDERV
jgi:carbamoyl-phosphate synthase large subunit